MVLIKKRRVFLSRLCALLPARFAESRPVAMPRGEREGRKVFENIENKEMKLSLVIIIFSVCSVVSSYYYGVN